MSYTPGPWSLARDRRFHINQFVDSDGFTLGYVLGSGHEAKANARLIAAAPELLEALQACRKYMYEHFSNTQDNAFDLLCAAIAKATGDA